MAGYIRQSTADIIPTATVRAAPINAEYNALRDAFAASGGHKHDGTTGEGEYVPLIADLDALNKVVIDTTNNRIGFFVEVSSTAVEQVRIQDGAVVPVTDNDIDLGTSSLEFKDLYLDGTAYIDTLAVHQSATITSNLTVNGNTTLGNAASDTITLTGDVASNITPSADSTYDLGAVGSEWRNLYIDGTANIDSLVADTADINAGTIDNTVIGGTTAAAADFTTMDASGNVTVGGTLGVTGATTMSSTLGVTGNSTVGGTLGVTGLSTLATVDINGGNIDATAIGSSTASSAVFTNLTASGTVNFAGATVSNLGSVTTAAIGGGTINNSVIGGSTPAAITGTTITSNSGFTGNLSGNVTGDVTGNLTGNVTSTGNSTLNNLTVNGTLDVTNTTIENVSDPTTAQQAATKAYVDGEITSLIGGAPGALDTLNELAAAINDDQNVYTTLTTSIATKLPKAGGTMSGEIAMGDNKITGLATPTSNADAATKLYVDNQTTQAETYAANALASQNAAAASYDAFDDRYLGAKSSDPTVDNDGNALITGALYFDSTNGVMKVYNGSEWANASSSVEGVKANFYYTATNAQTVFSGSDDNSNTLVVDQVGLVNVYMNGVRLHEDDYTISAGGNSVTLATGAATGDLIYLEVFGNFTGQSGAEVAITGGSITGLSALGVAGNASFGDNNKAIFGDGSDLQIYHTGSASYIDDAGTGNLFIRANDFRLGKYTGEFYLKGNSDGDVELYYDNAAKLATTNTGVDVTGTITSDGLTVDGGGNTFSSTGNNVQFNRASGSSFIDQIGASGSLLFRTTASQTSRMKIDTNGDISFFEDTGTTAKFFWDASAESLGIGTSSPSSYWANADDLVVSTSGNTGISVVSGTTSLGYLIFADSTAGGDNTRGGLGYDHSTNDMLFRVNNDTKMRIDSSGNVGIGTDSPGDKLHVEGSGEQHVRVQSSDNSGAGIYFANTGSTDRRITLNNSNLLFENFDGSSEYMRLDSSGNLLVGKTSTNYNADGFQAFAAGFVHMTADISSGSQVLTINRKTSDGDIAVFRKDGATVGSIGVNGGTPYIAKTSGGIQIGNGGLNPVNASGVLTDGVYQLGASNARYTNLYLSGGVYLGGTGSANLLDDYEEGTWTVTTNVGTITANTGFYTKIGDLVYFTAVVGVFSDTSSSSEIQLSLPFTSSSASGLNNHGSVMARYIGKSDKSLVAYIGANSNYVNIYANGTNGDNWSTLTYSDLTSGSAYLRFSICFKV